MMLRRSRDATKRSAGRRLDAAVAAHPASRRAAGDVQSRARARRRGSAGYTMIEVSAVLLILSIFGGLVWWQWTGYRTRTQDEAAITRLTTAMSQVREIYTSTGGVTQRGWGNLVDWDDGWLFSGRKTEPTTSLDERQPLADERLPLLSLTAWDAKLGRGVVSPHQTNRDGVTALGVPLHYWPYPEHPDRWSLGLVNETIRTNLAEKPRDSQTKNPDNPFTKDLAQAVWDIDLYAPYEFSTESKHSAITEAECELVRQLVARDGNTDWRALVKTMAAGQHEPYYGVHGVSNTVNQNINGMLRSDALLATDCALNFMPISSNISYVRATLDIARIGGRGPASAGGIDAHYYQDRNIEHSAYASSYGIGSGNSYSTIYTQALAPLAPVDDEQVTTPQELERRLPPNAVWVNLGPNYVYWHLMGGNKLSGYEPRDHGDTKWFANGDGGELADLTRGEVVRLGVRSQSGTTFCVVMLLERNVTYYAARKAPTADDLATGMSPAGGDDEWANCQDLPLDAAGVNAYSTTGFPNPS